MAYSFKEGNRGMDSRGVKKLAICGLDVFTDRPFSGNPTAVVPNADRLSAGEMQAVARELNLETTFVLKSNDEKALICLRYFMPLREIELCGHGTIGAVWALAKEGLIRHGLSRLTVETPVGLLRIGLEWAARNPINVVMDQLPPEFRKSTCTVQEVAQTLGIPSNWIASDVLPLMCASTGRAKLLIPLVDWESLDRISLDERGLSKLCGQISVSGLYPFTLRPRNSTVVAEARQFPHGGGVPEDPVTGVAACALGAYLVDRRAVPVEEPMTRLLIEQGHAIGRPGMVEVRIHVEGGRVVGAQIAGRAVTVSRTEMAVFTPSLQFEGG
jgi:PhzF family phenazine biosynthesis protein